MKRSTFAPAVAVAAAATLLLTGCGSGDDNVSGDAAAQAAEVDTAALDPGEFPTAPQPEFGTATPQIMPWVEGQRMAQFVSLPFEIDPALTTAAMPSGPIKGGGVGMILAGNAKEILSEGMMTGYSVTANDGQGAKSTRSVVHAVFRMVDAAAATKAAEDLHQDGLAGDEYLPPSTEERIDILPNTLVTTSVSEERPGSPATAHADAFTAHGDYVIYTRSSSAPDQKDVNAKTIAKALQLQEPMIDKFPATKKGESGNLQLDQGGVMKYTIPTTEDKMIDQQVDYGPRGMAGNSTNPPLTYDLLTEVGAEHNGRDATTVYQAKDEEGAKKIVDEFGADLIATSGWAEAPSVPGLPDSKCYTTDTPTGTADLCMISKGRYAAEAQEMDDVKTVHQKMAAQYMILEGAE